MAAMYHWMAFLVLLSPVGTLAAFIVDDSSKSASTCEPFLIQWQGGIAPWTLRILEASSESTVLENLGRLQATAFKWSVDFAAGTAVLIQLQDSTGAVALSKPLVIQPGSTECTLRATTTRQLAIPATQQSATSTTRQSATSTTQQLPITSPQTITTRTSSSRVVSVPTTTGSQSRANQQSSSPSFALGFTSASIASLSVHDVASSQAIQSVITGTGDPSQLAAGPYYSEPPAEAASTLKTPSHIGIILGTAIPIALLLLFICVFLWRRYRKRTAADHEELVGSGAPPWYMQPAYGFRHSQRMGSGPVASEPNHVPHAPPANPIVSQSDASIDSISRLSLPFQPSFVQSQGVSVPEYSPTTTPWTSGGLGQVMEMPPSPSEYPSPPPAY